MVYITDVPDNPCVCRYKKALENVSSAATDLTFLIRSIFLNKLNYEREFYKNQQLQTAAPLTPSINQVSYNSLASFRIDTFSRAPFDTHCADCDNKLTSAGKAMH